jgi:hypothetical protein
MAPTNRDFAASSMSLLLGEKSPSHTDRVAVFEEEKVACNIPEQKIPNYKWKGITTSIYLFSDQRRRRNFDQSPATPRGKSMEAKPKKHGFVYLLSLRRVDG